jgi:3-dehydroquinate synthetase
VSDVAHLSTLPPRELVAGLAEVVKIALTHDAALFERLERDAAALARGDVEALLPVIRGAIDAKIRVVRDDEREAGARALLNLGHTIGHALEAHGGYASLLHGEAVAQGLVAELRACARLGWTPMALVERTSRLLATLGLPSDAGTGDVQAAWPYVGSDKKRAGNALRLAVVDAPGSARIERVALDALRDALLG